MRRRSIDRRLLGTWRSDKKLTVAEWAFPKTVTSKARRAILALFGKFTMRYTATRIYGEFERHRTITPYRVLASDADSVAILRFIEDRKTEIQHVHFVDNNRHWVSVGRNREFFRRIAGLTTRWTATPSDRRYALHVVRVIANVRAHMLALFALVPIVLAIAIAFATRASKIQWMALFTIIAGLECIAFAVKGPFSSPSNVVASLVLGVLVPWGLAALYFWSMPYPRRPFLTASGVPVVYAVALIAGLVFGDASGLIPQ
jgi:hypothetical protein